MITLDPEIGSCSRGIQGKIVFEVTPPGTVPGYCAGCPDLGRMMFEIVRAGNGEGLENRVFSCILL